MLQQEPDVDPSSSHLSAGGGVLSPFRRREYTGWIYSSYRDFFRFFVFIYSFVDFDFPFLFVIEWICSELVISSGDGFNCIHFN